MCEQPSAANHCAGDPTPPCPRCGEALGLAGHFVCDYCDWEEGVFDPGPSSFARGLQHLASELRRIGHETLSFDDPIWSQLAAAENWQSPLNPVWRPQAPAGMERGRG